MLIGSRELPNGDTLEAIFYHEKYDQEVKLIDQSAEMSKYLGGLIHFRRIISFPYDQIIPHKDYSQGFIILARLRKSDTIIGKICGLIKDIYLFGKAEKAIYLFDIRVPVTTQKKGVGTFMLENVEIEAKRRGVTVQLMSINSNNRRMLNLSNKLGWQDGCTRKIYSCYYADGPLFKTEEGDNVKLEFIEPDKATIETNHIDLSLVKYDEITSSKNYLGQLRASTSQSSASVHLYKGDKQFGIVCQRLFLEPETYKHWHTWLAIYLILLACPTLLCWSAFGKGFRVISYVRLVIGLIGICLSLGFAYILNWGTGILNSPFIRVFGYTFKGKAEEQQKLCKSVFQMARRFANKTKSNMRLNEDPRAQYLQFIKRDYKTFGKGTLFQYKFIDREKETRLYDENNFFDPRDL